ncbi:chromo domain-containing protein LHP1 [Mangifera indica]|uniref:chromo domain-containing protein LHP1 n=1 Tax=Mangifera indica TaxID=29780 RepID=UPI001CF9C4E7|nr:chromo domain-containing protein LHP1 [Mangifera indica]
MKVKGGGKRKLVTGEGENLGLNDAVDVDVDVVVVVEENHVDVNEETQQGVEEIEEENNEEGKEEEDEQVPGDQESQEDRPKLAEGFFEVEDIRHRRVRKGQLQYLIKWRGWPETANTWEPLENLQSCSEVIDAFEESLRSGGKSSRKRKRKYGGPHTLSKKTQLLSINSALNVGVAGLSLVTSPLNNTSLVDLPVSNQSIGSGLKGEKNGDLSIVKTRRQTSESIFANGSKQVDVRKEETEYDPKLSELKGTMSYNEINLDKLALTLQEAKVSEGNGLTHGINCKVDRVESVPNNRHAGAKRRKSSYVKRFKQDLASTKMVAVQDSIPSIAAGCGGTGEQLVIGNSSHQNMIDVSRYAPALVKIIKPIDFSASVSDNVQDVLVTFIAQRSDGKEVMVDNKFLKAHDPHLLINFYEQHLRYSTQ